MNNEDKNAPNTGGNNNPKNEPRPPAENPRIITRRTALAGGISALALGVLTAKKAVAQAAPPTMVLGGLCQGRALKLSTADSVAWVQNMLTKSPGLQAFYNYFTAQGMNFILSRSQVFLNVATNSGATPTMSPNIVGILPSFVQINQSDPSHTAAGLTVNSAGYAFAAGVVVGHNPFGVIKFMTHDLVAGQIVTNSITATDLATMTVCEAAAQLGNPPLPAGLIGSNPSVPTDTDRSALLAMTYQMILSDSYSRALYPPSGLTAMMAQTPLVLKFGDVILQRYQNSAESFGITVNLCLCTSSSSNICTSSSVIINAD